MCSCDYDEGASCSSSSTPRARVRHVCYECTAIIEPGELYRRFTGVWDHRGATFKWCATCDLLAQALPCYAFGRMTEDAVDFVGEQCGTPAQQGRVAGALFRVREVREERERAKRLSGGTAR